MEDNNHCSDHSGCLADITHLKCENRKQWDKMGRMGDKIDSIMSKLNVVLGSIVVACIVLALNLIFKVN